MLAARMRAVTLIQRAGVAIIGTGCPGHLEAVSRTGGACPAAALGHIAGPGHRATERAGLFEAVGRAGWGGARAGLGHITGARPRATEGAGVSGWMLPGGRGAITLIEGAGVAIIRTGRAGRLEAIGRAENTGTRAGRGHLADVRCRATDRAGVAGRMLAGGRGAITLIEGAD